MGTVTSLLDRIARARGQATPSCVVVTAHGFVLGGRTVAWQAVSEIRGYRIDRVVADEAFLEFLCGGCTLALSGETPGFHALEAAMAGIFPSTAGWRDTLPPPSSARRRTLLYRRA